MENMGLSVREFWFGTENACFRHVFFTTQVATEGGYLWRYSADLKTREGEGRADEHTVWVQPPGTPSVGMAFLDAFQATGDELYLDAARQAGYCLVRGQLASGGWDYRLHFDAERRRRYAYRVDLRLRPEGQRGPMVVSLPAALHYYDIRGRTWERQAYIKARPVAGDLDLGNEFLEDVGTQQPCRQVPAAFQPVALRRCEHLSANAHLEVRRADPFILHEDREA